MYSENYSEYEIIDAHSHIFPHKIADAATVNIGNFYDLPMHSSGSSERLVEHGNEVGVKMYLVCSTATSPHQVNAINKFIAKECEKYPSFFGLGTLHPDSDKIDDELADIKNFGLHGIKIHPDFQKFAMDSKQAYKIYERIEGDLPILIHCGDSRYKFSSPKMVATIHRDFPKMKIIAAHFGGYSQWDEAAQYVAGLDNVRVDTSSSTKFLGKQKTKKMIETYGIENCFFGSDFPMWDQKSELDRLFELNLTHEQYQKIFAENFKSFFNINKVK